MRGLSLLQRFEEKFIPVPESGCWLWTASSHGSGYGLIHTGRDFSKGKMEFAHRVSYELYKGYRPSPDEEVCHKCDVTCCVNPYHLFIGSHKDNMEDMVKKERAKNGNLELTEEIVIQILNYPKGVKLTAKEFGIDSGYCSRLRNFKIKKWKYLENQG